MDKSPQKFFICLETSAKGFPSNIWQEVDGYPFEIPGTNIPLFFHQERPHYWVVYEARVGRKLYLDPAPSYEEAIKKVLRFTQEWGVNRIVSVIEKGVAAGPISPLFRDLRKEATGV